MAIITTTDLSSEERFKEWVKSISKNGDGRVKQQELRDALRSLGQRCATWKARRAMKNANLNRNNFIDGDLEIEKLMAVAANWGGSSLRTQPQRNVEAATGYD